MSRVCEFTLPKNKRLLTPSHVGLVQMVFLFRFLRFAKEAWKK